MTDHPRDNIRRFLLRAEAGAVGGLCAAVALDVPGLPRVLWLNGLASAIIGTSLSLAERSKTLNSGT
jgi:hypothetical protein